MNICYCGEGSFVGNMGAFHLEKISDNLGWNIFLGKAVPFVYTTRYRQVCVARREKLVVLGLELVR